MTFKERRAEWIESNPLRKWRKANGLSLMDAAAMLGASFSTVQLWETGARVPNDENLEVLAGHLQRPTKGLRASWSRWLGQQPALTP